MRKRIKCCDGYGWRYLFNLFALQACFLSAFTQRSTIVDSTSPHFRKVIAGSEYQRSGTHQWLWGQDYRKEWTTPVTVPVLNLDSAHGGLTVTQTGGGTQTRSLWLRDASGRNWVLRSVNKTYLGTLPDIVQGTFVANLANDQIATNHPYAALTVPVLAEAARVYHTNPRYYVVPHHPRLGVHNETFANTLCLLEERPDETHLGALYFGRPEDIVSTERMMERVLEQNDHLVDQRSYIRARLFDMFIGDWGRQKDNWRWARFDSGTYKIYRPIPRDRDQTFARFEGSLLGLILRIGKYKELQSFDEDIKSISWYNYPAYALDKRFTNALSLEDWLQAARELQVYLNDAVIERAVRQMPPEIFALSGGEIIRKLKSRRAHLSQYADTYYRFIARDVEVPGTKGRESFVVKRAEDGATLVQVFRKNRAGETEGRPVYSRTFQKQETREVRLYGVDGQDVFRVEGKGEEGIRVGLIGGPRLDSMTDRSVVEGKTRKTRFYDNPGNIFSPSTETRIHTSRFPSINQYDYETFKYDSRGVKPILYYNTFYRFFVGVGYTVTKNRTREGTFSSRHSMGLNYSLIERSFHPYYKSTMTSLINRWNLNLNVGYDQVRRFNYFGSGNETQRVTDNIEFYWMRMHTLYGSAGVDQTFLGRHNVRLDLLYNGISILDSDERYVSLKRGTVDPSSFEWKHFAGPQITYTYLRTNDAVVPTKGISFRAGGGYMRNFTQNQGFTRAETVLNVYLPIFRPFSVAVKNGYSAVYGDAEFYQQPNLGGFYTLRGYWRYRIWGRSAFWNQNELRWLPTVHGRLFSGRIGLVGFWDQGRVWMPGEKSHKWHRGYGGGVILVPFNRISVAVTYGISEETKRMNIRLGRFL